MAFSHLEVWGCWVAGVEAHTHETWKEAGCHHRRPEPSTRCLGRRPLTGKLRPPSSAALLAPPGLLPSQEGPKATLSRGQTCQAARPMEAGLWLQPEQFDLAFPGCLAS